jgi:hypothetical protein
VNPELAFFEWFRCPQGYRIANARDVARDHGHNPDTYPDEEWIVPNSNKRITYRCPMDGTASLATVFANVDSPDKLLGFVKQHGPLLKTFTDWGDTIAGCLRRAQRFRELLLCKEQGPRKVAALYKAQMYELYVREAKEAGLPLPTESEMPDSFWLIGTIDLVPDSARGVRVRLTTDTLIGAMLWQLGLKLSGATVFRECRECGKPFEAGPGADLRADSTFCCAEHSILFHSRRRRKEFKNA